MDRILYNMISYIYNKPHHIFSRVFINHIFQGNGQDYIYDLSSRIKTIFFQYLMEKIGKVWKVISMGYLINNRSHVFLTAYHTEKESLYNILSTINHRLDMTIYNRIYFYHKSTTPNIFQQIMKHTFQ